MNFLYVFFYISTMAIFGSSSPQQDDGVLDKIKTGFEYASNYLETAKDIADLVASSLGGKQKEKRDEDEDAKNKGGFGPSTLMSAFFRLFGLDSQKVTAIAVNSVIFLAQMISSLFNLKPKENSGRSLEDESDASSWDPARLITESKNERIQNLLEQARDENLASRLIDRLDGDDSSCIRLLVCKISPVIKAAQYSLKNKSQDKWHRMTSWLPNKDEFEENGDECENTHTDCSLFF